jgi:hypothetical protein
MCGEYLLPPLSKVRAVCGSTACTDLRGGRRVIGVPTATKWIEYINTAAFSATHSVLGYCVAKQHFYDYAVLQQVRQTLVFNFPQRRISGLENGFH